jgi:hypothetical protein
MGCVRMHIWRFQKIDVEMWNCHVLNRYKWVASIFIDFRVPPTTPWSMCLPQALFFLKKHAPVFLEHVFCGLCHCLVISGSPGQIFQIWPICSNDYASKTRIEILCKKTCSTAPHLFPKSHLLSNSFGYRTFARMSTWTIGLIHIHAQSD